MCSSDLELFEYDPVEQLERRLLLGPAKAKELEAEEKGEVETISWEIPEEFLGIGVRIEDDILVTEDGNENLSRGVPVEMDDIEAICAEAPRYTSAV